MNPQAECAKTEIICYTAPSSVFELLFFFTASLSVYLLVRHSDKGGFLLSHNFYVRSHGKITPQSQPLTQYNNQKQRINQIETEDIELNNYMRIFPLSGEVRERDSSVYVLV